PVAKVQEGLGGKAKAIMTCAAVGLLLLVIALIVMPYPLRLEAKGQVLPINRAFVYPPMPVKIVEFPQHLKPGLPVAKGQELAQLYSSELVSEITNLVAKADAANKTRDYILGDAAANPSAKMSDKLMPAIKKIEAESEAKSATDQLKKLRELYDIDTIRPGY